jgi:hypothetical protein
LSWLVRGLVLYLLYLLYLLYGMLMMLMGLDMTGPGHQLPLFEQWKPPSTLGALLIDVLLAHAMPDQVIVSEVAPAATDLGGLAEGDSVEVAEDFIGELGGKGSEEVDLELLVHLTRHGRELREAALRDDALQHQVAVLGGRRREEGPNMSDGLLVGSGHAVKFPRIWC